MSAIVAKRWEQFAELWEHQGLWKNGRLTTDQELIPRGSGYRKEMDLEKRCGEYLRDCIDHKLIPVDQELQSLRDWLDTPEESGRTSSLVRCAQNLWSQFVGNGEVRGRMLGNRFKPSGLTSGGYLPVANPTLFPGRPWSLPDEQLEIEREQEHVRACLCLADAARTHSPQPAPSSRRLSIDGKAIAAIPVADTTHWSCVVQTADMFLDWTDNVRRGVHGLHAVLDELTVEQLAESATVRSLDPAAIYRFASHPTPETAHSADAVVRHLMMLARRESGNGLSGDAVPAGRHARNLDIDLAKMQVTLDGDTHDVRSEQALRWLKVLNDRPGEWLSGRDLATHDPDLDGVRTDRLRRFLPDAVSALIQSETGKGSRINLSACAKLA